MPQDQEPKIVANTMGLVGRYSHVKGTTKFACYDRQQKLIGYYDVETGEVFDAEEKSVGRGFRLLAGLVKRK